MARAYRNPTEDMALGHIMLEEKKKRHRELRKQNRSPGTHSRANYDTLRRPSVRRDDGSSISSVPMEVTSHAGK